jgi:Fe-S-cluster containining protein
MKSELKEKLILDKNQKYEVKKMFKNFKTKKPKDLDHRFHEQHEEAFKRIDCLECANCCKTTSPIFRVADIRRIAKHLKVKESKFIDDYLKVDEDSDYVLISSPCTFLNDDNYCSIYEVRPLACREYPHTDRKNMIQILDLTLNNTTICPAVGQIVSRILQKNS